MAAGCRPDTLWTEPRDVFFFFFDPVWVECLEKPTSKRPVTLVEAFPLSFWIYIKELSIDSHSNRPHSKKEVMEWKKKSISVTSSCTGETADEAQEREEASLHALVYAPKPISLKMNHLQFLFLLRILDTMNEFLSFFTQDAKNILSKEDSFLVSAILPLVNASLVIPPAPLLPDLSTDDLGDSVNQAASEDLTVNNSALDEDLVSNPTSLSPQPSFSEEIKDAAINGGAEIISVNSMNKSRSDGCLSLTPGSAGAVACANIAESVTCNNSLADISPEIVLSKSGDELHEGRLLDPIEYLSDKRMSVSGMKKGLTSGFTSLMNTIESSVKYQQDDDTVSIQSDVSNDSDKFVMLYLESEQDENGGSDCLFKTQSNKEPPIETAIEVTEEPTSSEPSVVSHYEVPDVSHLLRSLYFKILKCMLNDLLAG